MRTGEQT